MNQQTPTVDLTRLIAAAQATTIAVNNLNQTLTASNTDLTSIATDITTIGAKIGNLPPGSTIVVASANATHANATATISAVGSTQLYITGYEASWSGGTAAGISLVSVFGLMATTSVYIAVPTPAASTAGQYSHVFDVPQPATGTTISVTIGDTGAGSTGVINVYGFYV